MPKNQNQVEDSSAKTFSLISNEKLLSLYANMLKCRLLEQRATALFQHGKIASDLHISADREATATAATIDLQQNDTLCLAQNDWLPAFVKGMSLENLFRVLAPTAFHAGDAIQIEAEHKNIVIPSPKIDLPEVAVEHAASAMATKNGAVAAAFIHSVSDSLTQWRKAILTAGTKKLPIIFVHYSDPTGAPSSSPTAKPEALVHGVPSIAVDARDPVAVYRVAYEAITRARQLRGATLLECVVESKPAPPSKYKDSLADPPPTDSVAAIERYLRSKQIEPEAHSQQIITAFSRELDLATRFLDK